MFLVVTTFTVKLTSKGSIIINTITIPTKLIFPIVLVKFFILFVLLLINLLLLFGQAQHQIHRIQNLHSNP